MRVLVPPHPSSILCACCVHAMCMLSRFSCVRLFVTPWTVAHQAPLSMGFSRQGYWNGLPCPPPGDLPDPGIEPASLVAPAPQAGSLLLSQWGSPGAHIYMLPICVNQSSCSVVSDSLRSHGL